MKTTIKIFQRDEKKMPRQFFQMTKEHNGYIREIMRGTASVQGVAALCLLVDSHNELFSNRPPIDLEFSDAPAPE